MSGTGYQNNDCVKTDICSKCGLLKTWNYWYHHDSSLCDDCYYIGGKYYDISKEEVRKITGK